MESKKKNPHIGHRQRLRGRFITSGLDGFNEHEVLELLLCYAISRRDVNGLAHKLIERFGSLSAVLDAPVGELMAVEGVGEQAAVLIKLIPQITRKYQLSGIDAAKRPRLDNVNKAGSFMIPYFQGLTEEFVYLLCLDNQCRLIHMEVCGHGGESFAVTSSKRIVELATRFRATSVLLAHNHPDGVPVPSREDITVTRSIAEALCLVDIRLADHIIVSGNEFSSMSECNCVW